MKRIAIAFLLLVCFALSPLWAYTTISPDSLFLVLCGHAAVPLVDVRENSDYNAGHIFSAAIMPWNSNVLQTQYSRMDPTLTWYIICASGARAASASAFLQGLGYTCVCISPGMYSWTHGGLYTTRYGRGVGSWIYSAGGGSLWTDGVDPTVAFACTLAAGTTSESLYVEMDCPHVTSCPVTFVPYPPDTTGGIITLVITDAYGIHPGNPLRYNLSQPAVVRIGYPIVTNPLDSATLWGYRVETGWEVVAGNGSPDGQFRWVGTNPYRLWSVTRYYEGTSVQSATSPDTPFSVRVRSSERQLEVLGGEGPYLVTDLLGRQIAASPLSRISTAGWAGGVYVVRDGMGNVKRIVIR